jgi:Spy/CpxP family protein refolding chaperone
MGFMRSNCSKSSGLRSGIWTLVAGTTCAVAISISILSAGAEDKTSIQLLAQGGSADTESGQSQEAPRGGTKQGSGAGGGSMSDRIGRYMDNGEGPGAGEQGVGMRRRLRERFEQMPEEKKRQILQRMKERRGGGVGFMDRPGGGPPGDGPPGGGPFSGLPEAPFGGPMTGGGPLTDGEGGGPAMGRGAMGGRGGMGGGRGVRNYRRGGMGKMGGGAGLLGRGPMDFSALNLSEEQKTKIQTMRGDNSVKSKKLMSLLRDKRKEMQSILFDPAASQKEIMKKRDELRSLRNQQEDLMLNDFLGIRGVLTKEQLQQLPQVSGRGRRALGSAPPGPPGEAR